MSKQENINYTKAWEQYYTSIQKYCAYFLRDDPGAVEDCCQEVFQEYWCALQKGTKIQNVQAWLYKVAYNIIKRAQKQTCVIHAISSDVVENTGNPTTDTSVDFLEEIIRLKFTDEELMTLVRQTLTEEESRILNDCFVEQKDVEEIAAELHITVNHLYKKKWYVKQKIKRKIHEILSDSLDDLLKR